MWEVGQDTHTGNQGVTIGDKTHSSHITLRQNIAVRNQTKYLMGKFTDSRWCMGYLFKEPFLGFFSGKVTRLQLWRILWTKHSYWPAHYISHMPHNPTKHLPTINHQASQQHAMNNKYPNQTHILIQKLEIAPNIFTQFLKSLQDATCNCQLNDW